MGSVGAVLKVLLVVVAVLTPTALSECSNCRSDLVCRDAKLDLIFIVDGSGSICGDNQSGSCANWITVLEFIVRIIGYLNIGPTNDQVGLIQFANKAQWEFRLGEYQDYGSITSAIQGIRHLAGNTNTSSALNLLQESKGRANADKVNKVAIVITDGISTYSPERTIPEADLAKAAGFKIYSIGITKSIDENEIRQISWGAQTIGVTYFILPDFADLKTMTIVEAVHDSVCVNYEINNRLKNCPGTYSRTGCYVVINTPLSQLSARSECSRIAAANTPSVTGELVSVNTQAMQDEMTRMISALNKKGQLNSMQLWLGAIRDTNEVLWTWSNSTTDVFIGDQGCFVGRQNRLNDLAPVTSYLDVSPDNCTAYCADKSFRVAGVQNGDRCSCGNVYGQFGGSSNCNMKCPGLSGSEGKCGGPTDNNIYLTGGVYGDWSYEQPNNYNAQAGLCGVISGLWGTWKMAADNCYKKKLYICQLNFDLTACRQARGSTTYRALQNKCLFVSRDQSASGTKSWFDAQLECKSIGGELLTVNSAEEHEQLKTVMRDVGLYEQLYWVALLGKRWTWPSGARLSYHNWGPDQPSDSKTENCMLIRYSTQTQGYTWATQDCSTPLPSICRIDLSYVPITTTVRDLTSTVTSDLTTKVTTPTTTTPYETTNITNYSTPQATAAVTTTLAPTSNFTDPNAGASTALVGGLGTVEIIVIVILCGLVVVGAIIGCIACAYHKKGKNKQSMVVYPDKADYLKSNVLTPYNQYYDQGYNNTSGLVMNPAELTKTETYGGEDHVYMKFNGGSTNAGYTETNNAPTTYGKRSHMYTDIPYHANNEVKTSTQTFSVKSQDFGTRRMASRDTSRMTISNDGRLINMNDDY